MLVEHLGEKYSWLLDVESAMSAEMGYMGVQYSIFELEALQAQEKLVVKRTGGKTMSWSEYCKICGDRVPVNNYMEGGVSLRAEKDKEEEANCCRRSQKLLQNQKRFQHRRNQRVQSRMRGHRVTRRRKVAKEKNGGSAKGQFPEK